MERLAGRYELGDTLGQGRSTVFRALDARLRRDVAIKRVQLFAGHEDVEQVRKRALREAQASARLNNPAVVTVYDVVEEAGAIWLVMELVDGPSLAQIVADGGPLPHWRAATIGSGVLTALEAAHLVGVVHRDVKPANVLVTEGDRAKLTDFGVATIRDESRVTATGLIVGSPSYMAPEQATGGDITPATDLWALGALLYFAVEGEPPFREGNALATAAAVVHKDPRPQQNTGPLSSLLEALLTKDPAGRPTGGQVRATLARVARGEHRHRGPRLPLRPRAGRTMRPAAGGGSGGPGAAGTAGVSSASGSSEATPVLPAERRPESPAPAPPPSAAAAPGAASEARSQSGSGTVSGDAAEVASSSVGPGAAAQSLSPAGSPSTPLAGESSEADPGASGSTSGGAPGVADAASSSGSVEGVDGTLRWAESSAASVPPVPAPSQQHRSTVDADPAASGGASGSAGRSARRPSTGETTDGAGMAPGSPPGGAETASVSGAGDPSDPADAGDGVPIAAAPAPDRDRDRVAAASEAEGGEDPPGVGDGPGDTTAEAAGEGAMPGPAAEAADAVGDGSSTGGARRAPQPPAAAGGARFPVPWLDRRRVLVAAVVVALLLVMGAAVVPALRGGGGEDPASGEQSPSQEEDVAADERRSTDPSPRATTAATAPGLPEGWTPFSDPEGAYTIGLPPGWRVEPTNSPRRIDLVDPATGSFLRIEWTPTPGPSAEQAWHDLAPSFARNNANYDEIAIAPVGYRDYDAALWEFRHGSGETWHTGNLGFVTHGRGYALMFRTPESAWAASQPTFQQLKQVFQPTGSP